MKYQISTIRRRSRNNGTNFCQYYVICDAETGEIIYDNDSKVGTKSNFREKSLRITLDKLNNGEIKKEEL
jgi:hypothetical protein